MAHSLTAKGRCLLLPGRTPFLLASFKFPSNFIEKK
jgi:hypothetical protein